MKNWQKVEDGYPENDGEIMVSDGVNESKGIYIHNFLITEPAVLLEPDSNVHPIKYWKPC